MQKGGFFYAIYSNTFRSILNEIYISNFLSFLSCNKPKELAISEVDSIATFSTSLTKAEEILLNQERIIQYLEESYQYIRIYPCGFEEDQNYYYFRFSLYGTPIHISENLDHKIIPYKNSFIILAKSELLDHQKAKDSLTLKLVQDSLISLEPETKIQCEVPYVNFIICKNDLTKVGYYDVDMINDSIRINPYKQIKEESFYPNCN